jgi:Cu(I)/Ag(I) efflux system membrane protein CusA/SilA
MGVKVYGRTLADVERFGGAIARLLKEVPGVSPAAVVPDQVVAKPYLEIELDRARLARYGVSIRDAQEVIEAALGGMPVTQTVEGRERYPVRVRYARELRDSVEDLGRILVPAALSGGAAGMSQAAAGGPAQIPLTEVAVISHTTGPQEIRSEGAELVSYVLFDKLPDFAEVDVVEAADRHLRGKEAAGELSRPAGAHYEFAGSYRNQLSFMRTFVPVLLLSLFSIFVILYFQFRSVPVTFLIFGQIAVAFSGGFVGMWLAAQPWFLDFSVFGHGLREVFHLGQYNLSVAVWVGFIAVFGIATDDQVLIVTYYRQLFAARPAGTVGEVRGLVEEGSRKRVRPCLMTSATTVLALLPILTSQGRGADVMIPMALPIMGAMTFDMLNLFCTPVIYSAYREFLLRSGWSDGRAGAVLFGVCLLCALPAVPAGALAVAGAFVSGLIPCLLAVLIYNAVRDRRESAAGG